ncbi:MAG: hypothetical protein LBV26_08105, partial [Bacteroidales bacterium]|nr:hypothetical protein [Bacteroidales bacterium]
MLLNKQLVALMFSLLLPAVLCGQAGKTYTYRFSGNKSGGAVIAEGQSLLINYSISELNVEEVENESGAFYRISIPGHTPVYDAGNPEIPVMSQMVVVPDGVAVKIKISEVKSERLRPSSKKINGILYPSQESESKSQVQRGIGFKINRELYGLKKAIPLDTVKIEFIGRLRDNAISNIMIYPVRYNPGTNSIEVITSMKIEISNVLPAGSTLQTVAFAQAMKGATKGLSAGDVPPTYSDKPVGMIILTDMMFKDALAPFIKWKTQKGFKVT